MFTGIVDHCGVIQARETVGTSLRLLVGCGFTDLVLGESVSVDGACLTVTTITAGGFWCDLSEETLGLTRVPFYQDGSRVNLERAMKLGDRLGGHIVSGHVDKTARVLGREEQGGFVVFRFGPFSHADRGYLVPKGSIGINGVSLTINEVKQGEVSVTLIPHTLEITNLSQLQSGHWVNIEFDWMTKLILNDVRQTRALLENQP